MTKEMTGAMAMKSSHMRTYIIRRLLLLIPTLFILSILVFLSVRFIPGDVIDLITARMEVFSWSGGPG